MTGWLLSSGHPAPIVLYGPEDICVFVPASIAPEALHGHLREVFGEPSRPDSVDDDRDVDEVRYLQQLYASRVAHGAGIIADFSEINKVYAALRDLGADADQSLVDAAKAAFGGSPYGSSYEPHLDPEAFDQRRANGELILDLNDDYETSRLTRASIPKISPLPLPTCDHPTPVSSPDLRTPPSPAPQALLQDAPTPGWPWARNSGPGAMGMHEHV